MEPYSSASYKKYLPSKKIQYIIVGAIVIILAVITLPKLITYITQRKTSTPRELVINQANPVARDTDNDGIMDWQEILVGLDPRNPETKPGTPDRITFQSVQEAVGIETFNQQSSLVSDTDKLGLTLFDALSRSSLAAGEITDQQVVEVTREQVADYLIAKKEQIKKYNLDDLIIIESRPELVAQYINDLKSADVPVISEQFLKSMVTAVEEGTAFDNQVLGKLPDFDKLISNLLAVPVPQTASVMHLAGINALYGLRQTIANYQPYPEDPLHQMGTMAVIQDYLNEGTDAQANLTIYFSVAADTNQ